MTGITARSVELATAAGGPARLNDLCAGGPVLLVFGGDRPATCESPLRRLAPVVELLARLGVTIAAVFRAPIEVGADLATREGFTGAVLAEPPPHALSSALQIRTEPTAVLISSDGEVEGRAEGCDAAALDGLLERACRAVGAPAILAPEVRLQPKKAISSRATPTGSS
jgi:hypothetical protein